MICSHLLAGETAQVIVSGATKIMTMDKDGNHIRDILLVDAVDVDIDEDMGIIYYINNTDSQVRCDHLWCLT